MKTLRTLRLLLGFLRPFWNQVLLSVLLGVATVAAGIGLLGASAYLIAAAALHPSVAALQVAIVGVRFFGICRAVFRYLERLVSHSVNFRLLSGLRVWFYRLLEPLAPARLQDVHSADLLSRAVADIETLENFYVRAVAPPLVALLIILGVGGFVGRYDPRLGGLLVIALLVGGVGLPLLAHGLARQPGRAIAGRRAVLNAALLDAIQGMPDLLAFGQAEAQARRIAGAGMALGRAQELQARAGAFVNGLGLLVTGLALWGMLWLAVPLVRAGRISGIDLAVLALVTLASFEAVTPLTQAAQHFGSSLQSAQRLFDLVDVPPPVETAPAVAVSTLAPTPDASVSEVNAPAPRIDGAGSLAESNASSSELSASAGGVSASAGGVSASAGGVSASDLPADAAAAVLPLPQPLRQAASFADHLHPLDLRIRRLDFAYPGRSQPALAGFDLDLPFGKRVALVGPSGAGKSTLFNLLLRYWEYSGGQIDLDGQDLRRWDPQEVRRRIALISQTTYLFAGSLRQNLLIARPAAAPADLERVIFQAQLADLLAQLPQGLDTWVGERGLQLSGGERQRVAVARALLRDAPLFLLDEPTANLDAATEQRLLAVLRQASGGRSLIHITHRLSGLEDLDEILVLRAGRIIERGPHTHLLTSAGLYAQMWQSERDLCD